MSTPGRPKGAFRSAQHEGTPMSMQADASTLQLDEQNPWPGLAAYDEGSQRFFHGRENDSAELLRLIRLSPFVALYGKSGLGKSSMLQAGLFPDLRAERFLPVYLRLDYTAKASPLLEQAAVRLRQEIDATRADAPPPAPGESLWAYLQRRDWPIWSPDNFPVTPVLVFDQFEEVFSRGGSPAHVNAVLESLADLVGDRLPAALAEDREAVRRLNLQSQQYRVVLSFRSDFLAEVEGWEKQVNLPRRESLHLTAMSRARAVQAVESAGKAVLEPGAAERIVDFLLTREGGSVPGRVTDVEPVLLSLCCYQLNKRRGSAKIDAALLQTVGEGILKSFYDEALEGMPPRVSVFIEENLIQGERFRNSYALAAALAPDRLMQDDLDALTLRRLLRVDPQGGEPRVELIHDRLVSVVREARDARRALEAQQLERDKAAEQVKLVHDRERLVQAETERAQEARWRKGLAVAATLLLALSVGLIYSQRQLSKATLNANARADDFARERGDALAELDKVKKAFGEQQEAIKAKESTASAESPSQAAAAASATAAAREVLTTLAAAEQKLKSYPAQANLDEAEKPAAAVVATAPSPPTEMATPPAKAPPTPAPTSGTTTASTSAPTLLDWRLSSGGCLLGDVTVTGTAKFWIETEGNNVVVREEFNVRDSGGFTVKVEGVRKPQPAGQASYVVETRGEWKGPKGRKFNSRGEDRVYVKDGTTPTRAVVQKFRTECPG